MGMKAKREQDINRRKRKCEACKRTIDIGEPVTIITRFVTDQMQDKRYYCNQCAYEKEGIL